MIKEICSGEKDSRSERSKQSQSGPLNAKSEENFLPDLHHVASLVTNDTSVGTINDINTSWIARSNVSRSIDRIAV